MKKKNLQTYYNRIISELILEEVRELNTMLTNYILEELIRQTKRKDEKSE